MHCLCPSNSCRWWKLQCSEVFMRGHAQSWLSSEGWRMTVVLGRWLNARQLLTANIFQSWAFRWCRAGFTGNPLPGHCYVQCPKPVSFQKYLLRGGSCTDVLISSTPFLFSNQNVPLVRRLHTMTFEYRNCWTSAERHLCTDSCNTGINRRREASAASAAAHWSCWAGNYVLHSRNKTF